MSFTIITCVDVGSVSRMGWWRADLALVSGGGGGRRLADLVAQIGNDLDGGHRVALGFEAPLFLPLPVDAGALGKGRNGEGNRPWSAAAGAVVTAHAAQQVAWTLTAIAGLTRGRPPLVGLDPFDPKIDLLVWEAFVSGAAKNRAAVDPHIADARAAVEEFARRLEHPYFPTDVDESTVFNLAGAAILRAGLSDNLKLVSQVPVVVRVGRHADGRGGANA